MKKGISLIVLVITIIVIIILAGAIILNLTKNNPIDSARIAKIVQEKESLESAMMLYVNTQMSKNLGEYSISDIIKGNANNVISLVNLNEEITIGDKLMNLADKNALKQNLNLDINNKTNSNWYIETSTGKFYLVYDDTSKYDSYLGAYNEETGLLHNNTISEFIIAKNISVDLPDEDNIYFGGSYTVSESTTNSTTFAKIANISGTQVTISDKIIGDITGDFNKDDEIALYSNDTTVLDNYGDFQIFKVSNVNGKDLTLDKVISQKFNPSTTQVIKLINYDEFTIGENVVVSPMPYDGNIGGVILIKSKKINIYGKIDASFLGYKVGYDSLTNGGTQASGNPSIAGGSNKYQGGNGGVNYQGYQGLSSYGIEKSNLLSKNKMYMGGGSANNTSGGGVIYIISDELNTYSEHPLSSNGKGGNNMGGGGAGGSIIINSKNINLAEEYKNYFAGANGGGGSGEILSGSTYPNYKGEDGTNIKGGNGSGGNSGAVPRKWCRSKWTVVVL